MCTTNCSGHLSCHACPPCHTHPHCQSCPPTTHAAYHACPCHVFPPPCKLPWPHMPLQPCMSPRPRIPPWTDRHLWKHNLRKLCLRAVIIKKVILSQPGSIKISFHKKKELVLMWISSSWCVLKEKGSGRSDSFPFHFISHLNLCQNLWNWRYEKKTMYNWIVLNLEVITGANPSI